MFKVKNLNEYCISEFVYNIVYIYIVRIYRSNFLKGNYEIVFNKYK